jgi:hypothetical protein
MTSLTADPSRDSSVDGLLAPFLGAFLDVFLDPLAFFDEVEDFFAGFRLVTFDLLVFLAMDELNQLKLPSSTGLIEISCDLEAAGVPESALKTI